MLTRNYTPSKDSFMRGDAATTNFGTDAEYLVGKVNKAANRGRICMSFNIDANIAAIVAANPAHLLVASLQLFDTSETGLSQPASVYPLLRTDWVTLEMTYNIYKTASNWTTAGAAGDGDDYHSGARDQWTMSDVGAPLNYFSINVINCAKHCLDTLEQTTIDLLIVGDSEFASGAGADSGKMTPNSSRGGVPPRLTLTVISGGSRGRGRSRGR